MSIMSGHRKERARRKQIARTVKRILHLLIGSLTATSFALLLSIGRDLWPVWLVAHRKQIAGILMFAIVLLILLAPIMIEVSSNTRRLSGPGRNPYSNRLDE
jgi:hypothetical protein